MRIIHPRERAWRARNPELARRFDKLNATQKANIRSANWERGTARLVRTADQLRRDQEKQRSQKRRTIRKTVTDYLKLSAVERSVLARTIAATVADEAAFWRQYVKQR